MPQATGNNAANPGGRSSIESVRNRISDPTGLHGSNPNKKLVR